MEEAEVFFNGGLETLHSPFLLSGMDQAVQRLASAVKKDEKILIYGDYDVDGLTAVALLIRVLRRAAKGNILYYIPKRLEEGYGLHREVLAKAVRYGCRLVVTADCGVTALPEAEFLRASGVDLIITDHHEPGPEIPKATAVVNPKLCPEYPFPHLAGVGVAFKLLHGLTRELPEIGDDLWDNLDLVALGTIADIVPVLGENRVLVKEGLKALNKTVNPGLAGLINAAGLAGKKLDSWHVGYILAPRLNACGRLGDSVKGLRLLLETDKTRAQKSAGELEILNRTRQEIEEKVYSEAVKVLEETGGAEKVIVLEGERWHPGVIGIVASRLVDRFHRPTVLLSLDGEKSRGSARSIPGFHIFNALSRCSAYLERFGGHELAAGLELSRNKLEDFRKFLNEVADSWLSEELLTPLLEVEEEVPLADVTRDFIEEVSRLAPFGIGNPRPVLACRGVDLLSVGLVGRDRQHLRIKVGRGVVEREAIGFKLGPLAEEISTGDRLDLAFHVGLNDWNNEVQLILKDLLPAIG